MKITHNIKPITLLVLATVGQSAFASGYNFGTQSTSLQSTANSSGAEANDASTLFSNPAGLTKLESSQITGSATVVAPTIRYNNATATHIGTELLPTGAVEVSGSDSGTITKSTNVAPSIYGAYKVNENVTLGLGVYVPYGSESEYQKNSKLRYNLNQLSLKSINIEPAIAFKANEQHSFGVGVIAQYTDAKLRKYADWGTARAVAAASAVSRARAALAAAQASGDATAIASAASAVQSAGTAYQTAAQGIGQMDGYANVKGDDWGVGYHLGYMYDINDRARIGVNYRSKIKHKLQGTAKWNSDVLPTSVMAQYNAAGYKASEKASVDFVTPESVSLQGMYRATPQMNLFGDVTWTRHSRFNKAAVIFENAKVVNSATGATSNNTTITPNWRNTYRVALGGSYQVNEPLQLRAGLAFDKSPVRNAEYRMNTVPDGNRVWFSLGAKYNMGKRHEFDLAYSHIHIQDTRTNNPAASLTNPSVDTKGATSANFKNYAHIVGAQYTYRFE